MEKPYVLIGGVASNKGIVKAFEKELDSRIIIPKNYNVMGAIGMALLVLKNKDILMGVVKVSSLQEVRERFHLGDK